MSEERMDNKPCPICFYGVLHLGTKDDVFTYKNHSIKYKHPGYWCDSCDEGIIYGDQILKSASLLRNFKMRVDNHDWED